MELKGSNTEKALYQAFCDEAKVYMKYSLFADAAKRQGYEEISAIFKLVADNEKAHAALWATRLGDVRSVEENLDASAGGENHEGTVVYKNFAKTARDEGFTELADLFEKVGMIELRHSDLYYQFLNCMRAGQIFNSNCADTVWVCRNCGNEVIGAQAPANCAVCGHPQAYFQRTVDYLKQ